MSGILPSNGVPPGSTEGGINNPQLAAGCANTYYPPRCNPRLDPFAMNNLISEVINALNVLGETYNCNVNNNLAQAMLDMVTNRYNYGNAAGSANAKTLTLSPDITAYVAGMEVAFRNNTTNTGAMTLNVNGLGVRNIVSPSGNPMAAGDVPGGSILQLIYDGTNWVAYTKTEVVVPPAPPSIGVGQSWVNVTAQRAIGTTYQNTTDTPIMVGVKTDREEGTNKFFEVSTNGSSWVIIGEALWSSGSQEHLQLNSMGPYIIPINHFYRVRADVGATLERWVELR